MRGELVQRRLRDGAVIALNSSVGNDNVKVVDAIRDTGDTRDGSRVVATIDLDYMERALGSV